MLKSCLVHFKYVNFQDISSEDYLGLGLRQGMLHLVWNLGWFSRTEMTIPKPIISDTRWHKVSLIRHGQTATIEVDGEVFGNQVSGSFSELNVLPTVFFGKNSEFQYQICV